MLNVQERSISISTKTILKVIITIILLVFLWAVRDVIALVFTALILAALMNPFAQWATRYKIPKGLAVILFYVIFFGGLGLSFAVVLPELIHQIGKLASTLGQFWATVAIGADWVRQFVGQYGLVENFQNGLTSLQEQAVGMLTGLLFSITDIFGGIAGLAVVLVMAFYMVVEEREALQWFKNFIPDHYEELAARLLKQIQAKFGSWLLGQLALSIIIGVLYYVGLRILGVEGALVLAILGGFTEFVPYLGPVLGGIPAVIIASIQSPMLGLLTLIFYIVVQQVENHILVPKIMQKAVGINPVVSIVALLVGAQLFGITGAILAIPVATACSVALMEIWKFQQEAGEVGEPEV